MKYRTIREIYPYLQERWGEHLAAEAAEAAKERFEELCRENETAPQAVKRHTEIEIFPCISLYEALQKKGVSAAEALAFLDESWSRRAEPGAKSLQKLLRCPGLHRLYPAIFQWVAKHQYGAAAGFEARFYDCGVTRCKFDMTRCLYLDVCTKYGCPELTQCFCHVDDVNNGSLHPRLCWNRTQYMGGGGALCDFDIFVKEE